VVEAPGARGHDGPTAPGAGELRQLVVEVGTTMVAAGDAVDVIERSLRRIVNAYGFRDVQIAVLPTSLFVETGAGQSAQVQFSTQVATPLRLDQIGALYELVKVLELGRLTPAQGLERLELIYRLQPAFRWPLRTLGHAVLTMGLALLLQPTPGGIVAALVLGAVVGLMKLPTLPTLRLVFPIVAAFTTSVVVFGAAHFFHVDNPIRLLVAPLVTFLPGGMLAIGTMEIAAGQMVSGASRLVNGLVLLALLAFGILAGAALVNVPHGYILDHKVAGLGSWAAWLGVVVFAVGTYLHFSAPPRALQWMLLVLIATFAAQSAGSALFGGQLSGFFGALVMTPLVLWVERLPHGPPKLVTFLPAFWLMVPGATGLIGLTGLIGTSGNVATTVFRDALITIVSISLGVLIGTAAHQTADAGAHRVAKAVRHSKLLGERGGRE
jgi:uncharacterized membrane protein YjjP (DUF1212 family)